MNGTGAAEGIGGEGRDGDGGMIEIRERGRGRVRWEVGASLKRQAGEVRGR